MQNALILIITHEFMIAIFQKFFEKRDLQSTFVWIIVSLRMIN